MTPTKTSRTEAAYRKRAASLIERIAVGAGKLPEFVSSQEAVAWLEANRTDWTAATFRQYRASLAFWFGQVSPKEAATISAASHFGQSVAPKQGQTSSKKKKHLQTPG